MLSSLLKKIDLWIISFVINLLSLALPIYVIQALTRYLNSGVDATLYSLTAIVLLSLSAEFLLRQYRKQSVFLMLQGSHEKSSFFGDLMQLNLSNPTLLSIPNLASRIQRMRQNKSHQNIDAVLNMYDMLFVAIFLVFIYVISPIAFITFLVFVILGCSIQIYFSMTENKMRSEMTAQGYTTNYAEQDLLSRAFDDASPISQARWIDEFKANDSFIAHRRLKLSSNQQNRRFSEQFLSNFLMVCIIFSSVILVFNGELQIGGLIALNILVARSFSQLMQLPTLLNVYRGDKNLNEIGKLLAIAKKSAGTSKLVNFNGNVTSRAVDFCFTDNHPNSVSLSNCSYHFEAGTTTAVSGNLGAGKSTFLRIITGKLAPQSGQVLIDGVEMQQISPDWWKAHYGYLSEEPYFLEETLHAYLGQWGGDDDSISMALVQSGLKSLVDHLPRGVNTPLRDRSLTSLKIRKRIGLAGIIAKQPSLIVLDEPTAGLDPQTALIFYNFINRMIADQRTLIIATSDPIIIKGVGHNIVIDDQGGLKPGLKNTSSRLEKASSKLPKQEKP
ncbi:ATP-binding cassette domain-containing protein [Candidatus Ponderosibacter sp. Uisw_141_02]|uniref:ATP-binding cassette domain-containing protein n=1 Tax=Candidatus Ponderosibacter sp. Uisw_141_02 TaxID=3231000 RepID=UPI003D592BFC